MNKKEFIRINKWCDNDLRGWVLRLTIFSLIYVFPISVLTLSVKVVIINILLTITYTGMLYGAHRLDNYIGEDKYKYGR